MHVGCTSSLTVLPSIFNLASNYTSMQLYALPALTFMQLYVYLRGACLLPDLIYTLIKQQ